MTRAPCGRVMLARARGVRRRRRGRRPPRPSRSCPPKDAITKTTENGPVKATVQVWPAKPDARRVDPRCGSRSRRPPAISIDAPFQEAGDQRLGRFRVVGFVRDTQRNADGGQRHEQTYTLEAPASGRHRIPPLRLEMIDARGDGGGHQAKPQELLTDEVPLEIAPVPIEQATAQLKPAARRRSIPMSAARSWVADPRHRERRRWCVGSGSLLAAARAARAPARSQQQQLGVRRGGRAAARARERGAPGRGDAPTPGSSSCRRSCAATSSTATTSARPS